MSSFAEMKFTEEELAGKSVESLADRPARGAAEMKTRLDSCDIREKLNQVLDALDTALAAKANQTEVQSWQNQLLIFNTLEMASVTRAMQLYPGGERFYAFFKDTGKIFCGTAADLASAFSNGLTPVWGGK